VISSRALNIFEQLYQFDTAGERLMDALLKSNDTPALETFAGKLQTMSGENAAADREKIVSLKTEKRNIRILAVDDSKPMRMFYRGIISELGIEPVLAENGQIALDLLESGDTFDLIIADLNMPVMDGIELTRKVRANPLIGSVPIIMGTTESDKSQVKMAEKSGVSDFVTKPINPELLKEKINSSLP
jgi:CheY-like chemotaxis protein